MGGRASKPLFALPIYGALSHLERLALNASGSAALHQMGDFGGGREADIAGDRVFQAAGGGSEVERVFFAHSGAETEQQPRRKRIAAANPIHDLRHLIAAAGMQRAAVIQIPPPRVVISALTRPPRDRLRLQVWKHRKYPLAKLT